MMEKNYIGFSLDKLEAVYGNPGPEGEENMTSLNPTKNTLNFQSSFSLNNAYFNKFNLQKEQYLNIIILKELVLEITTILIFSVIYMKLKPLLTTIQLLIVTAKV